MGMDCGMVRATLGREIRFFDEKSGPGDTARCACCILGPLMLAGGTIRFFDEKSDPGVIASRCQ